MSDSMATERATRPTIDQWALGQVIHAASRVAVAAERKRIREWAELELSIRKAHGSYANGQRFILTQLLRTLAASEVPR